MEQNEKIEFTEENSEIEPATFYVEFLIEDRWVPFGINSYFLERVESGEARLERQLVNVIPLQPIYSLCLINEGECNIETIYNIDNLDKKYIGAMTKGYIIKPDEEYLIAAEDIKGSRGIEDSIIVPSEFLARSILEDKIRNDRFNI